VSVDCVAVPAAGGGVTFGRTFDPSRTTVGSPT
jgi:hypothetical protein